MISLVKKDILSSGIRSSFFIAFVLLFVISFLLFPLDDYLPIIGYSLLLFAPLVFFFSIYNYTENDNYKSEILFPIKKSSIVIARYFEYGLITFSCLIIILSVIFFKTILGNEPLFLSQFSLIGVGVGVSLIFGALVLLLIFIFGQKNTKTIGIVSFILTLLPIRLFMEVIKIILSFDNVFEIYMHYELILSFILCALALFGLSCLISIQVFKRKEF